MEHAFREDNNDPVWVFLANELGGAWQRNADWINVLEANNVCYYANLAENVEEVRIHYLEVTPTGQGHGTHVVNKLMVYAAPRRVVVTNPANKAFWKRFPNLS
jgi:hypothetical protein